MKYNITEQGDNFFINGVEIPNEIFEQEKTDFKIVDRENFIDDLIVSRLGDVANTKRLK